MVLSDRTIREEIDKGSIVVDPLGEGCIQPASVDVHLGPQILVFRNSRRPYIDIGQDMTDLTEMVETGDDVPFILHPGEFVLGTTLENIEIPGHLVARLEGKSSLGRIGLLDTFDGGLRGPRLEGPPHAGTEQRRQPAHYALSRDEDRPTLFPDAHDACRAALRLSRFGQQVPRAGRSHSEPYVHGLPGREFHGLGP